ncbi:C2H2-type zinc finger transcription factor [Mucor lusitanicus CBS 277.49]|uniref:C2H2-type zinc finger transcription factor n=1 Tax=Mucor lusitanicus CBS 277.49 TaxID=747725 RepID=A0A168PBI6_MUCCL|nr:C2H2-type zinc finger transcription factor [Mucor lusitanicus CBS 277.49]
MDESTHQLGYGVMHLYRGLRPLTEQELPDTKLAKDQSLNLPTSGQDEDTTLCVLAVPSYMTFKDFTDFLGSANSQIEHYRFIRDFSPNKYTALLKFRDRQSAFACYQKFNGRRFNMTEPEISHVVYLESNTVESVTIAPQSYPYLNETLSQDLAHKTQDMAELPTCPVCLERMDESITGLQHIQCHHTTQCYCIDKWGHNQCPVCRYSQRPVLSASSAKKNTHYEYEQIQCECFECSSTESLWICMVCGHVGCGRYQEAHAYDHFMETNHLYALEIETQRVWDYLGDGYVHRLIQNTVDGAIVELPSRSENSSAATEDSGGFGSSGSGSADNLGAQGSHQQGKLDSISVDYTYMLTSQLDSQRMYYEEQLDALTEELSNLTSQVSTISQEIEAAKRHKTELIDKGRSLDSAIVDVKKEKEKADKRALSYKDKYEAMQKNLNEEKLLTKSLIRNNELLKKDADDKDATLKVLGDQVRDLMFFLEARDKVKEGSHDKSNDENAA